MHSCFISHRHELVEYHDSPNNTGFETRVIVIDHDCICGCYRTPLIEAAVNNHASIVTMLLDRRVNVAYRTRTRTTAAMLTRLHGNVEIQKVLEMREGLQLAHDALLRAISVNDIEYVAICYHVTTTH